MYHSSPTKRPPRRICSALVWTLILSAFSFLACSEDTVVIPPDEEIQKEERLIMDINYVSNVYFFLDNPYMPFIRPRIWELEVFESVTEAERQSTEIITYYGLAFVDTTARGMPIRDAKEAFKAGLDTPPREEGFFRKLIFGEDYRYILDIFDESVIGIELRDRVPDNKVLAVRYINEWGDTIGDYLNFPQVPNGEDPEDFPLFLELIRPSNPRPTDQFGYTWDFMLRNIYNLGIQNIDPLRLEIEIEDLSNRVVNTRPEGETVPYIRIFGLDQYDFFGSAGPDGCIDLQVGLIDFNRGLLTFPSLRPFDPPIDDVAEWTAWDESFVVPDDYEGLANTTIYYDYISPQDLQEARRYNIIVRAVTACPSATASADLWNISGEGSNQMRVQIPWLEVSR